MILISNHRFSTSNRTGITNFPLFNEGQRIVHEFDIDFDYSFNSTLSSQFEISQRNQITSLGLDFTQQGVLVGDILKIDAEITNGTDIDLIGTVAAITTNTITFTTNIFTLQQVNEIFPLLDNLEMFIVNQSRSAPDSIDLYYNLVPNSVSGNNLSLWDGEVNRMTAQINGVLINNGDISPFNVIGNHSGGAIISARIELVDTLFTVRVVFIPWLFIEQNNLTTPNWYLSNECVKPYIDVRGFSQSNNPNSFIQGIESSLLGNTGWYNESYNQGTDNFVVQNLVIEDSQGQALTNLTPSGSNAFSFEVVGVNGSIDAEIQLSIFSIIDDNNETKNNAFSRLQNTYYSLFYDNNQVIGNKNGDEVEFDNIQVNVVGGVMTVSGQINIIGNFSQLINSQQDNVLYRIAINVNDKISNQNVTKIVQDGVWKEAPKLPTPIEPISIGYNDHSQVITDPKFINYNGTTEDDMLYSSVFNLPKNEQINNIRFSVDVIRDSDNVLVATLFQRLFDFSNVVFLNGKYVLNENQSLIQFLDSQLRNQISVGLTGNETGSTYEVELIASLMANWRSWVALQNLIPDFYNQQLPSNGQSNEWVNYLRLSGYSIKTRVEVNQTDGTQLFLNSDIFLKNYDDSEVINSEIEILNSFGTPVNQVLANQIYTIKATHTLVGEVESWNDGTWGWIGLRPKNSEPMKRISTVYDVTQLNFPLEPLAGETKAKITFVAPNVVTVECQLNSSQLANVSTIVARINDGESKLNVTKKDISKITLGRRPKEKEEVKECCGEPWLVLADPQDSTTYKNDHTFVFEKAETMTVYTVHKGVESQALGVVVNFPNDPLAKGFVIDWRLYYDNNNELIQGAYDVWVEFTIAGQTTKYFYNSYKLLKFSERQAEGTVRIASIFNKYSEIYDIDFSGSGGRDSVRLRGFFGYRQPNYETKNNTELTKKRNNVFRKSNNTYQLIIEPTVECKTQRVEKLHLLHASECYISDFNKFNHYQEILELPVILSDDTSPEFDYFEGVGTKYARVLAEFKDKVSRRKSKSSGKGEQVEIPNIGLWEGVVCDLPSTKDLTLILPYSSGDTSTDITIVANSDGTINNAITTGLNSVVYELNNTIVTLPFTLAVGDDLIITFDVASTEGQIKLEGNYV